MPRTILHLAITFSLPMHDQSTELFVIFGQVLLTIPIYKCYYGSLGGIPSIARVLSPRLEIGLTKGISSERAAGVPPLGVKWKFHGRLSRLQVHTSEAVERGLVLPTRGLILAKTRTLLGGHECHQMHCT